MADNESSFSNQDMMVDDYRAFSGLSLGAFLVSIAFSTVAAVNPALNLITIFPIALAVLSVLKLAFSAGRSSGHILSAMALVIPVAVLSFNATYGTLRLSYLVNTAVKHSETWLGLVQEGKMLESHELTLSRYNREPDGSDLTIARGNEQNPKKEFEFYLRNQLDQAIREDGNKAKLTRVGGVRYTKERKLPIENFYVGYNYERPNGEKRKFIIQMRRHRFSSEAVLWNAQPDSVEPRELRSIYRLGLE